MLSFYSANVRIANGARAVAECIETAFGNSVPQDLRTVIVHATLGHKLDNIAAEIKKHAPNAVVLGNSCGGVVGRAGVGESMSDIAMMMVCGPEEECAVSSVQDIYGANAYEKGLELAKSLKAKSKGINAIYLLCPGIDINNALVIQAFDEVFGQDIVLFGGTSSDNMRALVNYQYTGDAMTEYGAWAVGFADPTLKAVTRATHGFIAHGEPMVVTKADGHKIYELNGKPAWQEYTSCLPIDSGSDIKCVDTIPVGALAEELPKELADEYGNQHILRAILKFDSSGTIYYPTSCKEGLKLWLTLRDEDLIFSEQRRSLEYLLTEEGTHKTVAVFQADCLARGRLLFNKVIKDEIIAMMHDKLSNEGEVPPWLGLYGFGEYAQLGKRNTYHNYSTALMVLYR